MTWKELKKGNYKNYTYYIYGKYTEDYPVYIDGEIKYKESIETSVKIMNPLGDVVHEMDWKDYDTIYEKYVCRFLISFRPIYKKGIWYEFFPKVLEVVHIEVDYERVLREWSSHCENEIDKLITNHDKERYEQEMTDGLPDSVLIKYLDR